MTKKKKKKYSKKPPSSCKNKDIYGYSVYFLLHFLNKQMVIHSAIELTGLKSTRLSSNQFIDRPKPPAT